MWSGPWGARARGFCVLCDAQSRVGGFERAAAEERPLALRPLSQPTQTHDRPPLATSSLSRPNIPLRRSPLDPERTPPFSTHTRSLPRKPPPSGRSAKHARLSLSLSPSLRAHCFEGARAGARGPSPQAHQRVCVRENNRGRLTTTWSPQRSSSPRCLRDASATTRPRSRRPRRSWRSWPSSRATASLCSRWVGHFAGARAGRGDARSRAVPLNNVQLMTALLLSASRNPTHHHHHPTTTPTGHRRGRRARPGRAPGRGRQL